MDAMERLDEDTALFLAMPERHLSSAAALGRTQVVLPLGRLGDVAKAPIGCPVYCVTLDDDGVAAPAATWRATLAGWAEPQPGDDDGEPEGLPPTWLADRATDAERTARRADMEDAADDDPDEDGGHDDDPERPRQVFVSVEGLRALEPREWVFGNEVVSKQRRGARSFVPMTPTLVRLPD
jgi:hypothetical protein